MKMSTLAFWIDRFKIALSEQNRTGVINGSGLPVKRSDIFCAREMLPKSTPRNWQSGSRSNETTVLKSTVFLGGTAIRVKCPAREGARRIFSESKRRRI